MSESIVYGFETKSQIDSCEKCPIEKRLCALKFDEDNPNELAERPKYECVLSGLEVELGGEVPKECPLALMFI